MRLPHIVRPPPVFAALDWRPDFPRHQRVTLIIMRKNRLLDPRDAFVIEVAKAFDRGRGRERLVVVGHDGHLVACFRTDRAHNGEIFGNGGISDLHLHSAEAAFRPDPGDARGFRDTVVANRAIRRDRLRQASEQPHDRRVVMPRHGVPKCHIDARDCHTDKPLNAEQTKTPCEPVRDLDGSKRLADNQFRKILNKLRRRF